MNDFQSTHIRTLHDRKTNDSSKSTFMHLSVELHMGKLDDAGQREQSSVLSPAG